MSEIDKKIAKDMYKALIIMEISVMYFMNLLLIFISRPIDLLIANIAVWFIMHVCWLVICILLPLLHEKSDD